VLISLIRLTGIRLVPLGRLPRLGHATHGICLLDYDRNHTGQILLGFLLLLLALFSIAE
jgi:hypothetical protein